jgi:hypothetical protein
VVIIVNKSLILWLLKTILRLNKTSPLYGHKIRHFRRIDKHFVKKRQEGRGGSQICKTIQNWANIEAVFGDKKMRTYANIANISADINSTGRNERLGDTANGLS